MNQTNCIATTLVADSDRMNFLPKMFGVRRVVRAETLVYAWMDRLCEEYRGGSWHFYSLSNGGMFLAPKQTDGFSVAVDGNGFAGRLSADAAGIVATLFALCQLANETQEDRIIDLYHLLRDFAMTHLEASSIMRAID